MNYLQRIETAREGQGGGRQAGRKRAGAERNRQTDRDRKRKEQGGSDLSKCKKG